MPDGEHHATLDAVRWLADHEGAAVVPVPLDAVGRIDPGTFAQALPGAAVATALVDAGFPDGTIVARSEAAGRALAERLGCRWRAEATGAAPLLVNVTPLGMTGADQDALAFTPDQIAAAQIIIDAVAKPVETPLLRAAQAAGKTVVTGAQIATLQALEQFVLYTGVRPSDEQVAAAEAYALS